MGEIYLEGKRKGEGEGGGGGRLQEKSS